MSNYDTAIAQIATIVQSVLGCPVRREVQSAARNWRDDIESGALTLPAAIIAAERMVSTTDGASGNRFRLDLRVAYLVASTSGGDQAGDIMSDLLSLWSALYTLSSPTFNLEEEGVEFDTSGKSEVMATFLNGGTPLAGGELSLSVTLYLTP